MTEEFTNSYNVVGNIAFASQRTRLLSFSLLGPVRKKKKNLNKEKHTNSKENQKCGFLRDSEGSEIQQGIKEAFITLLCLPLG